MNALKKLCIKRFREIYLLLISMTFSIVLLMLRIKLHEEFFFLFLVSNLFLAIIPYIITFYLSSKSSINGLKLFIYFTIWLAFLPNAPYILTDLIHLKITDGHLLWLDVILISSFAFNGLILFLISLSDMLRTLKKVIPTPLLTYFIPLTIALTGFGIYLGRFLRYNSWEIIQRPFALVNDIASILVHPIRNMEAWVFTLSFSLFLYVLYLMFMTRAHLEFDKDRDFH